MLGREVIVAPPELETTDQRKFDLQTTKDTTMKKFTIILLALTFSQIAYADKCEQYAKWGEEYAARLNGPGQLQVIMEADRLMTKAKRTGNKEASVRSNIIIALMINKIKPEEVKAKVIASCDQF